MRIYVPRKRKTRKYAKRQIHASLERWISETRCG
uniref:Uncharacterized protein n=1 Tax=Brassica oleracea TaxID=3712 RepID=A0A3P6D4B9_BRAOL|nr:unnamed protein product [Brassica oleracea]